MPSNKHVLVLLVFIACLAYLLRDTVYGGDSYYFIEQFGYDLLGIKIIVCLGIGVTGFILFKLAEYYEIKNPTLVVLFALACPALLFFLYKFEDDIMGFPFLLGAMYHYLKENDFFALIYLVWAGVIYHGSIVLLLGFGLIGPWFYSLLSLLALVFFSNQLWGLLPTLTVTESHPVVNTLFWLWLWIPVILLLRRWWHQRQGPVNRLEKLGLALALLGFINGKFVFLAVPVLSVLFVKWFESWRNSNMKRVLPFFALGILLVSGFALFSGPPLQEDFDLIRETLEESSEVMNSWSVGYWVNFVEPGRATAWGGGEDWDKNYSGKYVITGAWEELPCMPLKERKYTKTWFCYT